MTPLIAAAITATLLIASAAAFLAIRDGNRNATKTAESPRDVTP